MTQKNKNKKLVITLEFSHEDDLTGYNTFVIKQIRLVSFIDKIISIYYKFINRLYKNKLDKSEIFKIKVNDRVTLDVFPSPEIQQIIWKNQALEYMKNGDFDVNTEIV